MAVPDTVRRQEAGGCGAVRYSIRRYDTYQMTMSQVFTVDMDMKRDEPRNPEYLGSFPRIDEGIPGLVCKAAEIGRAHV